MADVIFVALVIGFFALAVGLVKLCERIVGGADMTRLETPDSARPAKDEAAA